MKKLLAVLYRFLIVLVFLLPGAVTATELVALVIGAESYREYGLRSPLKNATAVAQALENLDFEVQTSINVPYYELRDAVQKFEKRASGAEMSVLFYSGHTIKLGGNQYLIPVDVDLRSRSDIRKLIDIQQLLNQMRKAKSAVVLLDGCAESGFARGWGDSFLRSPVCADEASQLLLGPNVTLSVSRSAPKSPFLGGSTGGPNIYAEAILLSINEKNTIAEIVRDLQTEVEQKSGGSENSILLGNKNQNSRFSAIDSPINKTNQPKQGANPNSLAAVITSGIYRIENMRVNRSLAAQGGGLILSKPSSANRAADWLLETAIGSSFTLRNRNTGQFIIANRNVSQAILAANLNEESGAWRIAPVEFGSPGEQTIESVESLGFLTVSGSKIELRQSGASSASGWILRRQGDLSEVDIIPIPSATTMLVQNESPPIADATNTSESAEKVLPDLMIGEGASTIGRTSFEIAIAQSKFERLKSLLQNKRIIEVESMLLPGYSRDAFVHLMSGYSELDIQLSEVEAAEGTDSVYVDLLVRSLKLGSTSMASSSELRKARLVVQKIGQSEWSPIYASHCGTYCKAVPLILNIAQRK